MARVRRQVGIRPAQVRLPEPVSIGPAVVKTAATAADIAFKRAADTRKQEAEIAAADLNFERDANGNLLPPSLPIGENGLIAPSIYDRTYTQMVGQRYLQQMEVDTAERLNKIAADHILDPSGFQKVADAYVAKVTSLAPDFVRPDVNMAAQKKAVEHFNRIVRNRSEADWTDARNSQIFKIDNIEKELLSYALAGEDDKVLARFAEMEANLLQGMDPNFWGESYPESRRQSLNNSLIAAYITGDISRLPNDEVAFTEAVSAMNSFVKGEGKVKIIDGGEVRLVDVAEAMPDPAMRQTVASNASKMINSRKAAFINVRDARHQREIDEFLTAFTHMAIEKESTDQRVEVSWLLPWADRAQATNNFRLLDKIRSEIRTAGSGRNPTAAETDFLRQTEDQRARSQQAREQFAQRNFFENWEDVPDELKDEWILGEQDLIGPYDMPQTSPYVKMADDTDYWGYGTGINWHNEEQGGTPFADLERHIKTTMRHFGIIDSRASNFIGSVLGASDTINSNDLMRAISTYEVMRETDTLQGKLVAAFGEDNVQAMNFMLDHMAPSQLQDTAAIRDVIDRSRKGGLYTAWEQMEPEAKQGLEDRIRSTLESYNDPWGPGDGAQIPPELIDMAMSRMAGVAPLLGTNPSDKSIKSAASSLVEEVINSPDTPYHRSMLGLNLDKARGYGSIGPDFLTRGTFVGDLLLAQPSHGFSMYPPSHPRFGWGPGIEKDVILPYMQEELNKIDSEIKLRAGKNVHLVYNGMESARAGEPAWEFFVSREDTDPARITDNGLYFGQPIFFKPTDRVNKWKKEDEERRAIEQEKADELRRRALSTRM